MNEKFTYPCNLVVFSIPVMQCHGDIDRVYNRDESQYARSDDLLPLVHRNRMMNNQDLYLYRIHLIALQPYNQNNNKIEIF